MKMWIARHSDYLDNIIVGGDFNCALNLNDRTRPNRDSSRDMLQNFLRNLKLSDAWYLKHSTPQYTFYDNSSDSKSRIDYIFLSKSLGYKILDISLKEAPIKDGHKGVFMSFNFRTKNKGPGYWKLNAKLLEEQEYIEIIKKTIQECLKEDITDDRLMWEYIKIKIKEVSIKYGVERAKRNKSYIQNIQKRLDTLNKMRDEGVIIGEK